MAKITAERQRNAIIGLKATAQQKGWKVDVDALQAACETLFWLDAHRDEVRLAVLIKQDASVRALFESFPDAKISQVRKIREDMA